MRRLLRLSFLTALLFFIQPASAQETEVFVPYFQWRVGEELVYKVRYAFITVGTLRFQVLRQLQYRGRTVYHCRLYIDSSPGLPFVTIHDIYESYIDEDVYAHHFWSYERKGGYTLFSEYDFDYQQNLAHVQLWRWTKTDTILEQDTIKQIPGPVQDGLSILYFARSRVQKLKGSYEVAAFVFGDLKYAIINFYGGTKKVKVKGEKLRGFYLDGKLKFVGIAGIKEDFKGWFSLDPQAVPLRANMKAFIGSVRILLHSWQEWDAPGSIRFKNASPSAVTGKDSLNYAP